MLFDTERRPPPPRPPSRARRPRGSFIAFQLGSGPVFAGPWRTERGASTVSVVGHLPLRLAKKERRASTRADCRRSFLTEAAASLVDERENAVSWQRDPRPSTSRPPVERAAATARPKITGGWVRPLRPVLRDSSVRADVESGLDELESGPGCVNLVRVATVENRSLDRSSGGIGTRRGALLRIGRALPRRRSGRLCRPR
jgi:hypothetical protein